ncbi:phosphoserine phosphatase [Immersiella caudata]|uniref:Phosphoserine phosphatase n=1 Tax=Immersiella caudata TaxID=314043 RepID=A0AA39WE11_9PEZI|nr:phosphoserine phosphatase [Immersiella caudata]
MSFPGCVNLNLRMIFFTDFDGTVTHEDVPDLLVATYGYGLEKLRESNQAALNGRMTYREACQEQLESIRLGFNKCIDKALILVQLDPGFLAFYEWAGSVGVPIVVLSGGLTPMIEAMLKHMLGHEALDRIKVVANDVAVRDGFGSVDEDGGAWRVVFRDDSVYGNDKGRAIVSYASHFEGINTCNNSKRPISLFAGDGVSDLSAAGKTDLLFAKRGEDLVQYCKQKQLPFIEFTNWENILKTTQDL